jgi:hypothetical protein
MMNTQALKSLGGDAPEAVRTLRAGGILPLGSAGGRLEVLRGRVWLTRSGDLEDHVIDSGQGLIVPPSGRTLVEDWGAAEPAVVAWRPGSVFDRIVALARAAFGRCWDIVDPVRRIEVGAFGVVVALSLGAFLFGPLSESRTRTLLAAPTVLHNSAGARTSIGLDAGTRTGSSNDVSADARERARITAQQARRRPAGPA